MPALAYGTTAASWGHTHTPRHESVRCPLLTHVLQTQGWRAAIGNVCAHMLTVDVLLLLLSVRLSQTSACLIEAIGTFFLTFVALACLCKLWVAALAALALLLHARSWLLAQSPLWTVSSPCTFHVRS